MNVRGKADLDGLCRLCMCVSGPKLHLFESRESRDRRLRSKLEKCVPLQIKEDDTLPKGVCERCAVKVEEIYDFINLCTNTESTLKSYCSTSSVSDQLKCQGKVYIQQSIENKSNVNSVNLEKSDNSDQASALSTVKKLSNLVHSGSIQIINDIKSQYQDFCRYKIQIPSIITSFENGVEPSKNNYTKVNSSNQSDLTALSNDGDNNASENVQAVYSVPDISSPGKGDSEMNMHSSGCMTSLTVEPDMLHFELKSKNNLQDSDLGNSRFNDKKSSAIGLPSDGNLASYCPLYRKVLESKEEMVKHNQVCTTINSNVNNLSSNERRDIMPPKFSCDVCGKNFKRKEHAVKHRKLHTDGRPFICTTCQKSFCRKEHLTRHIVIHTDDRVYGCDLCHKHFNRKDNLNKHLITHGVKGPFACKICG